MKRVETFYDLYTEFLRDLYNAEVLVVSEMLAFQEMVVNPHFKKDIQGYLNTSRLHVQYLEELIEEMDQSLLEDHCRSMRSMISETKKLVVHCETGKIKDFAIAASLQRINQCKLNLYRILLQMADDLNIKEHKILLKECVNDEYSLENDLLARIETQHLKQPEL